ncbi:MAG: hypothetical protein FWE27_08940 [Defluviitaleaceae bacterium]|nr:hypothetical protein [Defluviitaleaceae bacterium]
MTINGTIVDVSKLVSKDKLLDDLKHSGASDRALSEIRSRYSQDFGNELIWQYPICDGVNLGITIVAVKEGFIALPFNNTDSTEYELFDLERAYLLNENELLSLISEWSKYSENLLCALIDMLKFAHDE